MQPTERTVATTDTDPTPPSTPTPLAYVPATRNEVIKVIAVGLVAGLLVPFLSWLIAAYIIQPVFCNTNANAFNVCASGGVVANHVAAIIVAVGAFIALTRWSVYRALLLVVAVTIAMWGLKKYADPLTTGPWIEYYLFFALLHGVAYAFFYWILRLRNFLLSLILTVLAVIAACIAVVV